MSKQKKQKKVTKKKKSLKDWKKILNSEKLLCAFDLAESEWHYKDKKELKEKDYKPYEEALSYIRKRKFNVSFNEKDIETLITSLRSSIFEHRTDKEWYFINNYFYEKLPLNLRYYLKTECPKILLPDFKKIQEIKDKKK